MKTKEQIQNQIKSLNEDLRINGLAINKLREDPTHKDYEIDELIRDKAIPIKATINALEWVLNS